MQETPETRVQSPGWEDPLEEEMATHSSILPGESHGQRGLVGYSPRGRKESTGHDLVTYLTHIDTQFLYLGLQTGEVAC